MSRLGKLHLVWGDGEYDFQLRIKELIELDEVCDAGPEYMRRLMEIGSFRVKHVRETIRLGLIGGGLEPVKAYELVKRYVDDRPLMESVLVAESVLAVAIVGMPEDEPEKKPDPEAMSSEQPSEAN